MHRLMILLLLATSVAGCADDDSAEADDISRIDEQQQGIYEHNKESNRTHLVDHYGSALLGTDLTGGDLTGLCEQDFGMLGRGVPYYYMPNIPGQRVNENHTKLIFVFTTDNVFSDLDITGYRIGAFYDHELVFWTEPLKESAEFTYEFGGNMPDIDKDVRWTFFFKRTDPTTEDDEHACTAGHRSGYEEIQIYAE